MAVIDRQWKSVLPPGPRRMRHAKAAIDGVMLAGAFLLAFLIRFEGHLSPAFWRLLVFSLPAVILLKWGCCWLFGIHRLTWRYVSLREAGRLFAALALAMTFLVGWRLSVPALLPRPSENWFGELPLGVLLVDLPLSFLALAGVRVAARGWSELLGNWRLRTRPGQTRTLLIGAGDGGAWVARESANRPDLDIEAVGFLDDDPVKWGMVIHGVPVLGPLTQLQALAAQNGASQVLITIARADVTTVRRIACLGERAGLRVKVVPGLREIVEGGGHFPPIREVAIEDLLHRRPVILDRDKVAGVVRGRTVLVTGAGGSIGSELCREICRFAPRTLVLVEKTENNLFLIHREIVASHADADVVPCLADVGDEARMRGLFAAHRPEAVFHAAAHKHVPMMEWNPGEAVKNNVLGTRALADLAHAYETAEFVLISTDKAVNPTSVMGVSKRVAELYVRALSERSATRFVTVRFGNVLGSAGSVIPIFKAQIARGGPVTVTHPEMRRYFMTIPEACQLVLQAASMGRWGELFILDMGEPVKVVDLARDLIRLSGLSEESIEIFFTGMRPGEKLVEELSLEEERAERTAHPRIFVGRVRSMGWEEINRHLEDLRALADCPDRQQIHAKFKEIVPEYHGEEVAPPEPAGRLRTDRAQAGAGQGAGRGTSRARDAVRSDTGLGGHECSGACRPASSGESFMSFEHSQVPSPRPGVAVVGSGYWGKNLVRNFHALGALAAVCDSDEAQRAAAAQYPGCRTVAAFEEVLGDSSVGAVALATPAETHGELVRRALLAGKDVFVEKPLCLSAEEGRGLVALARERQRVLMVGHLLWYHPAILKLKELIEAGELGRIEYIYSNRLNLGKIRREENILWSFAPHDISVILGLLDEMPERVQAQGGSYLQQRIADVTVSLLTFPSGVKAHVFVSWLHPFKEQKLVVVGDRQMAVFDDVEKVDKLLLYPHTVVWKNHVPVANRAEARAVPLETEEPLRQECLHFLDCVRTRRRPRTDGEEGLRVLTVLQQCQQALTPPARPDRPATRRENGYVTHESAFIDGGVEIGEGTTIWHVSHVMKGTRIGSQCRIGQNVVLGPNAVVGDGVKIQNNVSVYEGVTLEDNVFCGPSVVFTNVINPRSEIRRMDELRRTLVRRGASLGANCTVVCGVTIGRYAFVGAGAVVTRDVPDYALVTGSPARVRGWVCECGLKLTWDADTAVCSCGKNYSRSGEQVRRAELSAAEGPDR